MMAAAAAVVVVVVVVVMVVVVVVVGGGGVGGVVEVIHDSTAVFLPIIKSSVSRCFVFHGGQNLRTSSHRVHL